MDVLIVLDDGFRLYEEIERLVEVEMELFRRYECLLSFTLLPASRFRSAHHPLMLNVRQEGVAL